jgi:hypothetical protein
LGTITENNTRAIEIEVMVEKLRRATLRYVYDFDEPSYKEGNERAAKAIELLQVAAKTTTSEERRKLYNAWNPKSPGCKKSVNRSVVSSRI